MMGRRGKSLAPTMCLICILGFAGYAYYLYNEQYSKYVETEGRLGLIRKKQTSLKSQLQVVYEHRTKLEDALIKERKDHRSTKQGSEIDFVTKMRECNSNLTRTKHEAMNRFNALDTEHKMLKAKHEEISTDYSNLQQQYVRLTEDHQKIITGQKEDFDRLKDSKEKESRSLQERVETLYNEKEEQKTEASKYVGYYRSERNERVRVTEENSKLKDKMEKLEEQSTVLEDEGNKVKVKLQAAEQKIQTLEKKTHDLEKELKIKNGVKNSNKIPPIYMATTTMKTTSAPSTKKQGASAIADGKSKLSIEALKKNKQIKGTPDEKTKELHSITHSLPTMSKLVKKNVEPRILGKRTTSAISDLKPSDKVQNILIGKQGENQDFKKEDSIMDEYDVSETPKEEKSQGDREFQVKPTVGGKNSEREMNFQNLVTKSVFPNVETVVESEKTKPGNREGDIGALPNSDEQASMKETVQDLSNNLDDKLAQHLKEEKETRTKVEETRLAEEKENLLDKDRVSQFSKLKAAKSELEVESVAVSKVGSKAGSVKESKKPALDEDSNVSKEVLQTNSEIPSNDASMKISKIDLAAVRSPDSDAKADKEGDSFLRKQQKLMHRPAANEGKSEGLENDALVENEKKQNDHKADDRYHKDTSHKGGQSALAKKNEEIRPKSAAGNVRVTNQLKPPKTMSKQIEDEEEGVKPVEGRKRQQLKPPIKKILSKRSTVGDESEIEKMMEGKSNENEKNIDKKDADEQKDALTDEDAHPQQHFPIKKPKAAETDGEKEAKPGEDYLEAEDGDQDLDGRKWNEDKKAENVDADDESRTDEKDFLQKKVNV